MSVLRTASQDMGGTWPCILNEKQLSSTKGGEAEAIPLEKKVLIMKLKLMVVTVNMSRKTKTSVGSL